MPLPAEHPRLAADRHARRAAPARIRGSRTAPSASSATTRDEAVTPPVAAPPSSDARASLRDRGSVVLLVFTAATLLMVGLISLAAVVDRAWILVPVMAIDLSVTIAVLATIARLMDDVEGD